MTLSFDVFFDLSLNKQLSKQSRRWWFETQSRSLWRHCNATAKYLVQLFFHCSAYVEVQPCLYGQLPDCEGSQRRIITGFDQSMIFICDERNFQGTLNQLYSWKHHDMAIFSALLTPCEGNPSVTGGSSVLTEVTSHERLGVSNQQQLWLFVKKNNK